MDDGGPTASIICFAALLLIDMFFYGFGAAIAALNEKEVERRAEEEKDRKSIRLKMIISNPAEYEDTVQLITILINIVIGAVHLGLLLGNVSGGLQFVAEHQLKLKAVPAEVIVVLAAILSALLLLYITLTMGVLLPKTIAARAPDKWAYFCITPVYILMKVLMPFTGLVRITARAILRIFGVHGNAGETDVTEEEIINMVNEGHEQG